MGARLCTAHLHSGGAGKPDADWTGKSGLVHKAIMDDFVSLHDYDIYVAGRFEMAGAAREEFRILGAEPERIFGDAYEFI